MTKLLSLTIDGKQVSVPEGTLIIDAAKKVGIDIPVFCYHPKLKPVGMCRMCLVEVGYPVIDRATGQIALESDGSAKISMSAKLETACTTPVSSGMVVICSSEKVKRARNDILEFLLTSHPLDCPICDKGGECPLQNLTIRYGPGKSRYIYDEKMHLAKQLPLGELIYLDRERCIQCARCIRFQDEIVDDAVIGFYHRGRSLEIVSYSEPGFDTYWSGNTTDICPVGALTTTDFRFSARPWELNAAASLCTHCPVGCNITINTRREAASGGQFVIKRLMPRQNEWVNEIWICDKGRFAYHFTESKDRLQQPLVRKEGVLQPADWDEALRVVADHFQRAGDGLLSLAGGRLSNEDLFNLRQLTLNLHGKTMLYSTMAGGDLIAQVGVGTGTNLAEIGAETSILVIASDLAEEAPLWWLRIKQAAERGATLIVANPRPTKLDRYACHLLRYPYGSEAGFILAMLNTLSAKRTKIPATIKSQASNLEVRTATKTFASAENALIFYGSEGIGLSGSQALAQACANLLIATGHIGRPDNGLIAVWQHANDQGAWDMGFRPQSDLKQAMKNSRALYIVAADPAGDDPELAETGDFMVVQDLFLTDTARLADVVLPVKAFTEREGSFTSGERRVQRYFPATSSPSNSLADFTVIARIAAQLGISLEERIASRIMDQIAAQIPDYMGLAYGKASQVTDQWPVIGLNDLFFGGTAYENRQGLGVQLTPAAQRGEAITLSWIEPPESPNITDGLLAVPITRLYDQGQTLKRTQLLHSRLSTARLILNPTEAAKFAIMENDLIEVQTNGNTTLVIAQLDENTPPGVALIPRSTGIPLSEPKPVKIEVAQKATA